MSAQSPQVARDFLIAGLRDAHALESHAIGRTSAQADRLAGCASKQGRVQGKEDLLAAAGFDVGPATTPGRQKEMAELPPNHFLRKAQDDRLVYLYPDPLACNCLYIGDAAAHGRYRAEVLQRRIADEPPAVLPASDVFPTDTTVCLPGRSGFEINRYRVP